MAAQFGDDSKQRTMALLYEAQSHGEKTLALLDEQGEQIRRIENTRAQIDSSLGVAESQLSIMESFKSFLWGTKPAVATHIRGEAPPHDPAADPADDAWEVIAPTGAPGKHADLEQGIRTLHHIAVQVGQALDAQNAALGDLSDGAERTQQRVLNVNRRADKLLH
jgi:hypothetical protein